MEKSRPECLQLPLPTGCKFGLLPCKAQRSRPCVTSGMVEAPSHQSGLVRLDRLMHKQLDGQGM